MEEPEDPLYDPEELGGVLPMSTRKAYDVREVIARLVQGDNDPDALIAVSSHVMKLTHEDPALVRLMFNNSLESGDVPTVLFQEIRMPYIEFLTQEFERRMQEGEIMSVEAFLTGRCFVGMVMDCALNVSVWSKINRQKFIAHDVVCNNIPIFARGLVNDGAA